MQTVIKIDPVSKDKIEFQLQLCNKTTLLKLIPSLHNLLAEQRFKQEYPYIKYIFYTVKNKSSRNAIHIKFYIFSSNSQLRSPDIIMRWLPPAGEDYPGDYGLIYLGNPSLGLPDPEVKLDVEILELQRK